MFDLLTWAKLLIGVGLVTALLAVTVGGPDLLTVFLTVGQASILGGIGCYTGAVIRELREEGVL